MPIVAQALRACSRRPARPLVILYVQKRTWLPFRDAEVGVEVEMDALLVIFSDVPLYVEAP